MNSEKFILHPKGETVREMWIPRIGCRIQMTCIESARIVYNSSANAAELEKATY